MVDFVTDLLAPDIRIQIDRPYMVANLMRLSVRSCQTYRMSYFECYFARLFSTKDQNYLKNTQKIMVDIRNDGHASLPVRSSTYFKYFLVC